jgi:Flp pilus assembly pilin Flp
MARGTELWVYPRLSFSWSPLMDTRNIVLRLVRDEAGQDTIEYVLLTAGIGIVTIATWPGIETAIRVSYQALDNNTQNIWVPPDPAGGGS